MSSTDPFESAKTLLHRAQQHITEFDAWLLAYRNGNPYEVFHDYDVASDKTTHKARVTKPPPGILAGIAFDCVNCLRSSLDHAVFDASKALSGNPSPKYTKFPFGIDAASAANDLRRKHSQVPECLHPFLLAQKPYPHSNGGNQTLWGLNELRNGKIHQILAAVISGGGSTGVNILGSGRSVFTVMSEWDGSKNEYTFLVTGGANEVPLDVRFTIDVQFGQSTPFADKPAPGSLKEMFTVAAGIVFGIEAETARLKVA
jgi:hypothetical protein